jgi:DNA-binding transcriptional MerR regulator
MNLFPLAASKLQLNQTRLTDESMYLIGDVADLLSVEPSAIRYYEKVGLLRPQRSGRFRFYRGVDVRRLATILFLRKCGMSISGIRGLIAFDETDSASVSLQGDGPREVERQLRDLIATHREIIDSIGEVLRVFDLDDGAERAADNRPVAKAFDERQHSSQANF